MPLVADPHNIRLAMVGLVAENGHPYSWSAIFNGFDPQRMAECPYPVIPQYLTAQPPETIGIPGARVTHIWCEAGADARHVAAASRIPHVVDRPTDVIGHVDAVIIPTDIGHEHLERARPFVEAGLPLFIDKPLTDRIDHLGQFIRWVREGRPIMSTSALRYSREFADVRRRLSEAGRPRLIAMTMAKSWERYGIHALEGVYPFLEPGQWISVTNTGRAGAAGGAGTDIVHLTHRSGVDVVLAVISDLFGGFGCLSIYGTKGHLEAQFRDTFFAFKAQLEAFVEYLRRGVPPVAFEETVELMKIIIAGIRSREEGGRTIQLDS